MTTVWLVFGDTIQDVVAVFPDRALAENFAATQSAWHVAEARVQGNIEVVALTTVAW